MKDKNKTYQLTACALFAALLCILGPMSVPIGPIPVSLTNLVLYLAVYLLGTKGTTVSFLVYLLLGAAGLPVFSSFQGGLGKLVGPTGGYLVGFLFMVLVCGIIMEKSHAQPVITALGMAAGTLLLYVFGTVWFVLQAKCEVGYALSVCVLPFLPFDLIKIVIATALGKILRSAMGKAGLIITQV